MASGRILARVYSAYVMYTYIQSHKSPKRKSFIDTNDNFKFIFGSVMLDFRPAKHRPRLELLRHYQPLTSVIPTRSGKTNEGLSVYWNNFNTNLDARSRVTPG